MVRSCMNILTQKNKKLLSLVVVFVIVALGLLLFYYLKQNDDISSKNSSASGSLYIENLLSTNLLFSGKNIYSPHILKDGNTIRVWYGGWLTEEDVKSGQDVIYYTQSTDGGKSFIKPKLALKYDGYQINDPSVVKIYNSISKSDMYLMYYSLLPMKKVNNQSCWFSTPKSCRNTIGLAVSTDAKSWSNVGEVIPTNNRYDNNGAWSPSVLKINNSKFLVYYNTDPNSGIKPQILVTTLTTGGSKITETKKVKFIGDNNSWKLNVDISKDPNNTYHMFYNTFVKDKFVVKHAISSDGITWNTISSGLTLGGGNSNIVTPNVLWDSRNTYSVYFGFDSVGNNLDFKIHKWQYSFNPK